VQNLNVAVREWTDQIIFLRKIFPGRADQSYGIQVARLAGLPGSIITRAKKILEKSELNAAGQPTIAKTTRKHLIPDPDAAQLALF
jgi:DNA mismatch repair protein MutS